MRHGSLSLLALGALLLTGSVASAETWDMPVAYPDSNYHYGKRQGVRTLRRRTAPGASSRSPFIRTVRCSRGTRSSAPCKTAQAPIGERLLSAHENENPLFAFDSVPFLATSFDDSARLWEAAEPKAQGALGQAEPRAPLFRAMGRLRAFSRKRTSTARPIWRASNSAPTVAATARLAELMGGGARPDRSGGTEPSAGDGCCGKPRFERVDRVRQQGLGTARSLLRRSSLGAAQHRVRQQGCLGGNSTRPRGTLSPIAPTRPRREAAPRRKSSPNGTSSNFKRTA